MRLTKARIVAIFCAVLLALSLIPVPYLASPDWEVWVVDQTGNPVRGALVRLSYTNYSVEATGGGEDCRTDAKGYAHFPSRRRYATTLARAFYTTLEAMALAHGSFGPTATVLAFAGGLEGEAESNGYVTFWNGHPDHMKSKITLRPSGH